jgi:alanyl-tRNA synthetase
MAEERGYEVDVAGFEEALNAQRERSRADRARSDLSLGEEETLEGWTVLAEGEQRFVGYETREIETEVLALKEDGGELALQLRENPFYLEAGGQVSDVGTVSGSNWTLRVEGVRPIQGRTSLVGALVEGKLPPDPSAPLQVRASVGSADRHDTERNHTATHLLHAALREVLGEHVVQRGSLVAPDRLRFDFAHHAPMSGEERARVEELVNQGIWADHPVRIHFMGYPEATRRGAMALFGEKYGEEVRVVEIPDVSLELCGGTHCRHTGEIGLFRIVAETGVAAGVRRIEALTGPGAVRHLREMEDRLQDLAGLLKTRPENLEGRLGQLLDEKAELEKLLADLRKSGGGGETPVAVETVELSSGPVEYRGLRLKARGPEELRDWGDGYRAGGPRRVAVVAAELPEGRLTLFAFVSDDLIGEGIRADSIIRQMADRVEGKGGGRPHMAQAGVGDPSSLDQALKAGPEVIRELAAG